MQKTIKSKRVSPETRTDNTCRIGNGVNLRGTLRPARRVSTGAIGWARVRWAFVLCLGAVNIVVWLSLVIWHSCWGREPSARAPAVTSVVTGDERGALKEHLEEALREDGEPQTLTGQD